MAINHDPNSEDFKQRVQAYIMFFRQIGILDAAKYCVHQDATIAGLTANNESFAKAYRESLDAEQGVHPTGGTCPHISTDFKYICARCFELVPATSG